VNPALVAEGICHVFHTRQGELLALDGVGLVVGKGEFVAIVGPSGCGKSTLLRVLGGLLAPTGGWVHLDSKPLSSPRRQVAYVFQKMSLMPWRTVLGNVLLPLQVAGVPRGQAERRARDLVDLVGLTGFEAAYPRQLSGGMAQRVAIARALVSDPEVLLLDEPLGQLDAKVRNEIRYEIRKMAKDLNLTAIHVTHDQSEAMSISDRIAVMKKGKIVQVGTPQELYMSPNCLFVAHFIGESNFLEGIVTEIMANELEIELRGCFKVRAALNGAKKGNRVVLAVRPEIFTIERGTVEKENALVGKVEKITFEGTFVRYVIKLESQDSVVVIKPSMAEAWFEVGTKVTLSFAAEKTHVFPYPKAGLTEEISV